MAFIEVNKVSKNYIMGKEVIKALDNVSFSINKGELVVVLGPSGAGKTTVLNILGGMDNADSGTISFDGSLITSFNKKQLMLYRRNSVGFVFQFYNLVQNLTALENVELASQICKNAFNAKNTLENVGLSNRLNNFPSELSGGEQQRVAIARAIAKNPGLLLCDEPTGALDSKTGIKVLELLQSVCTKYGTTVIIITHNTFIAPIANRVIKFKNGKVEDIIINDKPDLVKEIAW
ncbi:MAG: ABC transporter ATP-binding protein [Bacilli bacterium]